VAFGQQGLLRKHGWPAASMGCGEAGFKIKNLKFEIENKEVDINRINRFFL
jgi:hypothetical protein